MATQPLCPVFATVLDASTSDQFADLSAVLVDMAPVRLKNRSEAASGERIYCWFAKQDGTLAAAASISIDPGGIEVFSAPPGSRGLLYMASDGAPDLEIIVGSTGA